MRYIEIAGQNVPVSFSASAGRLIYCLSTTNPEMQPVRLRIALLTRRPPWRVAVSVRGVPECLRHRYADDSLCLWWESHPNARRWMPPMACRRSCNTRGSISSRKRVAGRACRGPGRRLPESTRVARAARPVRGSGRERARSRPRLCGTHLPRL